MSEFSQAILQHLPCHELLQRLRRHGADFAELYFEMTVETRVRSVNGRTQQAVTFREAGVGIRGLQKVTTFFAHTSDLRPASLATLVEQIAPQGAAPAPRRSKRSPRARPTRKQLKAPVSRAPEPHSLAFYHTGLRLADEEIRRLAPRLRERTVQAHETVRHVLILNSEGLLRTFAQSIATVSTHIVLEKHGRMESGYEVKGVSSPGVLHEKDFAMVARAAVQEAKQLLASRLAPGGNMPVVLGACAGGTFVHEAVGHALEADLTTQDLSVFSRRLGERIGSRALTVVDDPTVEGAYGSFPFDDEGTPTKPVVLVEKGILKNYLSDRLSARRGRLPLTGSARRESYAYRPLPRMSNISILPGKENPQELIGAVPAGIFVEKMGGGEVDTITGSFVFEVVRGQLIRNGALGDPIRGALLIGHAPDILRQSLRLGADQGVAIGVCSKEDQDIPVSDQQPTLLIPELTVGAKGK